MTPPARPTRVAAALFLVWSVSTVNAVPAHAGDGTTSAAVAQRAPVRIDNFGRISDTY